MNAGIIANRYARALLRYANEEGNAESLYTEIQRLLLTFKEVKELHTSLMNPVLSVEEKTHLLLEAAEAAPSSALHRFLPLVMKEKREEMIAAMAHNYITLYRKEQHIIAARLITAVPLDKELKDKISRSISKGNQYQVELSLEVDAAIEGGFIYEQSCNRLDASVAQQLRQVKKQFIERNRRIV